MKKNKGMLYGILGIAFILFNVLAFVIPGEKTVTFWIGYVFSVIAFIAQAVIWNVAFDSTGASKSRFLGISTVVIGTSYWIVQLIAFAVFLAFPFLAAWMAIVICTVILGMSAIFLISTEVGKDEVKRVDDKVGAKVSHIKNLQIDVELLADSEQDANVKNALKKLAKKIRYSDPMSDESLAKLEITIAGKIGRLKSNSTDVSTVNEILTLIDERAKKLKQIK